MEDLKIFYDDGGNCHVVIKRKNQTPHEEVFGKLEADAMTLSGKDNYKKQAANMYKWRALSACLRVTFSDVICGVYTHEELQPDLQVNSEGELLKEYIPEPIPQVKRPEPIPQIEKSIQEIKEVEAIPEKTANKPTDKHFISDGQRKRMFAISKEMKVDNEKVKEILKSYGFESSNDVTRTVYDLIISEIIAEGESKNVS